MTIAKSGCFACHDIPGFEDAKPIGTALSDWGRKDPTQLAFEHIVEYLHHRDHAAGGTSAQGALGAPPAAETPEQVNAVQVDDEFDLSFYRQRLEEFDRVGFIWQKLKEPRSFDYLKTENKPYLERLRMPQFSFSDEEREAVITFVLGLVADPPADEFVFHPGPRQRALVEGRTVLDKYNCAGCHILEAERWEIEYQPGDFRAPTVANDFPFVRPHVPVADLKASLVQDPLRGVLRGTVTGMLAISDDSGRPVVLDEEGDPIEAESEDQYDPATLQYRFDLWQPAILGGEVHHVGVLPLTIPAAMITKKHAPWGGDVTRLLLPRVVALEKQVNPAAKGSEAWGWLPPPLVDEGQKVQPDWLHGFLLDPHLIRPSVVMRMPRFNMSSDEATRLVNYFAAKADAAFPFAFSNRLRDAHLTAAQTDYRERLTESNGGASSSSTSVGSQQRFDHAMSIVTNGNYCVQCHLVADFVPAGSERAKAPDLARVYRRLRPDWVRRWVANPKSILPYTGMPVNIPFDPAAPHLGGVSQELYHGTSIEQLDAVVDLIMNYDRYASRRSLIAPLVKPASPAPVATAAGSQGAGAAQR
jgi:cbb3-type cytochrome oxidase cytochrome c subunit